MNSDTCIILVNLLAPHLMAMLVYEMLCDVCVWSGGASQASSQLRLLYFQPLLALRRDHWRLQPGPH